MPAGWPGGPDFAIFVRSFGEVRSTIATLRPGAGVPRPLSLKRVIYALIPLLLLSGCRIERTPSEFFDHVATPAEIRAAAEAEVRDRLLAFVAAAARGDALQGILALNPAADALIVAPAGIEIGGDDSARAAIAQLLATPVAVEPREVEVRVSAVRADAAWFRMQVEGPGSKPEPALYDATGTFVNMGGLWTLVQVHISGPMEADLLTTDSVPNPPDSVGAPGAGEAAPGE